MTEKNSSARFLLVQQECISGPRGGLLRQFEHTSMPFVLWMILYNKKKSSPHYAIKPQMCYLILYWDLGIIITLVFRRWPTDIYFPGVSWRWLVSEGTWAKCQIYSVITQDGHYALLSAGRTELMALKTSSWPLYHQADNWSWATYKHSCCSFSWFMFHYFFQCNFSLYILREIGIPYSSCYTKFVPSGF